MAQSWRPNFSWRGGRAVDCAGLENRKAERPREFESHPLRHTFSIFDLRLSIAPESNRKLMNTTRVAARPVDCIAAREAGEQSGAREINNLTLSASQFRFLISDFRF